MFEQSNTRTNSYLRQKDVLFENDMALLLVEVLKPNPFKSQKDRVRLSCLPELPTLCPVALLKELLAKPGNPSDPLFSFIANGQVLAMNSEIFNQLLRTVLAAAGVDSNNVSTPSFRRGGPTSAAERGISHELSKAQENRRSNCYSRYIEREFELRTQYDNMIRAAIAES